MLNMCAPNVAFDKPCYVFTGSTGAGGIRLGEGQFKDVIPLQRRRGVQSYVVLIQARPTAAGGTPDFLTWSVNTGLTKADALASLVALKEFVSTVGQLIVQPLTTKCEALELNLLGLDGTTFAAKSVEFVAKVYECWATGTEDCLDGPDVAGCRPGSLR